MRDRSVRDGRCGMSGEQFYEQWARGRAGRAMSNKNVLKTKDCIYISAQVRIGNGISKFAIQEKP